MVKLHVFTLTPPLEQPPDQIASRPLVTLNVITVPVVKLALPVVPTLTLRPTGLERTVSPVRPVAVTVNWAVGAGAGVRAQTFAIPPPPQTCGAVHVPQTSVPPQPSEIVPQFLPCAAHVVGVQATAGFTVRTAVFVTPSEAEIVVRVETLTAEVATVKLALVAPAGTVTLAGTLAAAPPLASVATAPPAGAAEVRVTVPVEKLPPTTVVGFKASEERVARLHTLATPPPPQV